jgi:hypothetical protein
MRVQLRGVKRPVSETLRELAQGLPPDTITLRQVLEEVGGHGLLMVSVLLTVPFLLPVSIPGTSTPFGLVIALLGLGVALKRAPWLPGFVLRRSLATPRLAKVLQQGARLFQRLEKLVHPRLPLLTDGAVINRLNAILLTLAGLLLALPLPIPLTNTFPAWAALLLAMGTLERDGYFVVAGYVMFLLSIALFGGLAIAALVLGKEIGSLFGSLAAD